MRSFVVGMVSTSFMTFSLAGLSQRRNQIPFVSAFKEARAPKNIVGTTENLQSNGGYCTLNEQCKSNYCEQAECIDAPPHVGTTENLQHNGGFCIFNEQCKSNYCVKQSCIDATSQVVEYGGFDMDEKQSLLLLMTALKHFAERFIKVLQNGDSCDIKNIAPQGGDQDEVSKSIKAFINQHDNPKDQEKPKSRGKWIRGKLFDLFSGILGGLMTWGLQALLTAAFVAICARIRKPAQTKTLN